MQDVPFLIDALSYFFIFHFILSPQQVIIFLK